MIPPSTPQSLPRRPSAPSSFLPLSSSTAPGLSDSAHRTASSRPFRSPPLYRRITVDGRRTSAADRLDYCNSLLQQTPAAMIATTAANSDIADAAASSSSSSSSSCALASSSLTSTAAVGEAIYRRDGGGGGGGGAGGGGGHGQLAAQMVVCVVLLLVSFVERGKCSVTNAASSIDLRP